LTPSDDGDVTVIGPTSQLPPSPRPHGGEALPAGERERLIWPWSSAAGCRPRQRTCCAWRRARWAMRCAQAPDRGAQVL